MFLFISFESNEMVRLSFRYIIIYYFGLRQAYLVCIWPSVIEWYNGPLYICRSVWIRNKLNFLKKRGKFILVHYPLRFALAALSSRTDSFVSTLSKKNTWHHFGVKLI